MKVLKTMLSDVDSFLSAFPFIGDMGRSLLDLLLLWAVVSLLTLALIFWKITLTLLGILTFTGLVFWVVTAFKRSK